MKSKKWFISLGLAVVLVVAFAIPACTGDAGLYWYTPEDEKVEFEISAITGPYFSIASMVAEDLQDLGMDVTVRVLDSTTFYEYLYEPNLGGLQAFISAEDPSPDPWSDWIWIMLSDPQDWGYMWNPTWYDDEEFNELWIENFLAPNLSAKQEVLYGLQQNLAENVPVIFIARENLISVYREDSWVNWFNELGGPCTWINEYAMREVTPVGNATQLKIGSMLLMSSLNMEQESLMYSHAGCLYLMMCYENLAGFPKVDEATLESNPESAYDFIPKLATSYEWDYEADGTGGENQILRINLREGVKWQDYDTEGKNMTADDVVYTLQYVTNKWAINKPINWTAVEANDWEILPEHVLITKTGDYQVELRFIEGWHQNEDFFPSVYMWDAVVPKHKFESFEDPLAETGDYIGTGPWKVLEWEPDEYLLFERFDDYWAQGDEGDPYWELPEAEQILWRLYNDFGQMWLALEAGEIDTTMGWGAPFAKYDEYVANPELTVEVVPALSVYYLGFNIHPTAGYEPLQDLALREAIAAAIDKENIVNVAFGSYAEVSDTWTYNESPNHKDDLPNNEYDPTEAASILTAAGYTKHS